VARLRGLRAHGVDVTAVAARQAFALPGDPPADLGIEVIDVAPNGGGWAARLDRIRAPRGELGRGAFAARVRELAREADVVHLEEVDTAPCVVGASPPSLVQLNYLARRDRDVGRPWSRAFRDLVELVRAERAAVGGHRWLAANSPDVAQGLRRLAPGRNVVVAPLCLDPQYYRIAPLDGPPVAGMIGHATWPPTAATLQRLLTRVWPRVLRHLPGAQLRLAGRGIDSLLRSVSAPGVDVVGEVESAAEWLRTLSVLLYPIERGSGMKVKTLESLAVGVPVVTTPAGTEGVDAGDGAAIERDDAALAGATVELLTDHGARRQRGQAARAAFERRYTPMPATVPLVEAYRRMASGE
jgi:glycosyltransferase involved in cell wall biosynthesis